MKFRVAVQFVATAAFAHGLYNFLLDLDLFWAAVGIDVLLLAAAAVRVGREARDPALAGVAHTLQDVIGQQGDVFTPLAEVAVDGVRFKPYRL